jgi:hypothetical protein
VLDKRTVIVAAAIVAIVALSATLTVLQPGTTKVDTAAPSSSAPAPAPAVSKYPLGKSFIRIRALEGNSVWSLDAVNAQQVLGNVTSLKPDVLERFVSGPQVVDAQVPVAPGSPPMTVGEFLNASTKACGCYIIPRLSLSDYDVGTLFTEAQSLLTFPVYPNMVYLSLDNWGPFASNHTAAEVKGMFQRLYSQGWIGIGVNECGGYWQSYGYATFADFCVSSDSWKPISGQLAQMKNESNIGLRLLYIDFPQPMMTFSALSPDEEAKVLNHNIAPAQSKDGFIFVYPIMQDFWNCSTHVTSQGSNYHGKSLYDLMKGLIARYDSG